MGAAPLVAKRFVLGRWVGANVVAFTAAGVLAGTVLRSTQRPYYGAVSSIGEAVRIEVWTVGLALAIFGAIVGLSQWWVIRGHKAASWRLPATVVGWAACGVGVGALAGVSGGSLSTIGPASVPGWVRVVSGAAGLVVGLLPGTLQWFALRRHVQPSPWWPVLTLLGLAAGFGTGLFIARDTFVNIIPLFRPEDFPSAKIAIVVTPVAGSVYALITGPALARLLGGAAGRP